MDISVAFLFSLFMFCAGVWLGYLIWGSYKIYKARYDFLIDDWNRLHKGDKKNV